MFLSKSYLKIWENLAWNMIKNSLCEKMALSSKLNCFQNVSVGKEICWKNFFLLIQSNWVRKSKKFTIFCKMQHFEAILKIGISLVDIWTFLWWLRCHLTQILLIVPKQCWCHFEAFECIFHLSPNFFTPYISWLSISKIERFRTYGGPCIPSLLRI